MYHKDAYTKWLEDIFEKVQAAVLVYGKDRELVFYNSAAKDLLGLENGKRNSGLELGKKKWFVFENGERMPIKDHPVSKTLTTGEDIHEYPLGIYNEYKGSFLWLLAYAKPMFDLNGRFLNVAVTFIDITKRKLAENALKGSVQMYRNFFNASMDCTFITSKDGKWLDMNQEAVRLFGYGSKEELEKVQVENLYKDPRQRMECLKQIEEKGYIREMSMDLRKKNNSVFHASISCVPLLDEYGEIKALQGTIRDITDQKNAEEALREREEHLQGILQTTPEPLVVYNKEGIPLYINPAFTNVFGWTFEELKGRQVPFVPEKEKELTMQKIKEIYQTGEPVKFETKRLTKEGEVLDTMINAAILKGSSGYHIGLVVSLTDLTRIKHLESQFQQAQKLKAIGTLAGGIAHNFNNVLMAIQGRISLMLKDRQMPEKELQRMQDIEEYIRSASYLTKNLLGFARGGKYELKPLDLNKLIEYENEMFAQTRKDIKVHFKPEENIWAVRADQSQMQQVLMNIYLNSGQAMPEGGEMFVQTENISLSKQSAKELDVQAGKFVKLSIQDSGLGMDEPTRERIFEPFFSAGKDGKGTGLGLASVYGIISNHDGFIDLHSKENEGTRFEIFLPAMQEQMLESVPEPPEEVLYYGKETILLVDDEEIIAEVGAEMLESLGYRVFTAGSGQEAIDFYKEHGKEIDLVILDMIMQGMSGKKTFFRLKEIDPNVQVLLNSGYSYEEWTKELMDCGCKGFIKKPFNMAVLSSKLREILDSKK